MKSIIIFVLYLSFLFSNQTNNINTSNRIDITRLNKAFYYNDYDTINNYWKENYPYLYKRYKNDIISIARIYTSLLDDKKESNFKDIIRDKNKLEVQLSILIRKARDLALKNKDINLLISFLKHDLYTIAVSEYIDKQCKSLNTKNEIDTCLQIINNFKNDPDYNNKDFLLPYQKKISKIKQQIKVLDMFKQYKCPTDYGRMNTIEELKKAKECFLKEKEELLRLNKVYNISQTNSTIVINKFNNIKNDIDSSLKDINDSLNTLQKEKSDNLKFWISIILSIIMGFVALIIAKRSGVNLNETVIIEHTKSDKRYKKGYRVEGTTRTTKGLQIFGSTVIISFFILYFLLF